MIWLVSHLYWYFQIIFDKNLSLFWILFLFVDPSILFSLLMLVSFLNTSRLLFYSILCFCLLVWKVLVAFLIYFDVSLFVNLYCLVICSSSLYKAFDLWGFVKDCMYLYLEKNIKLFFFNVVSLICFQWKCYYYETSIYVVKN